MKRKLGKSNIEVSGIGLGCWAIGGKFYDTTINGKTPLGWGDVDDEESIRAIKKAIDLGVNFFDTADFYGCGKSEKLLGQVIKDYRDEIIIATKFGKTFDEYTKQGIGYDASPEYITRALEGSLKRLQTDYIDLYQFHLTRYDVKSAIYVRNTLDSLVDEKKVRFHAWSTDDPARAKVFAESKNCIAVQHTLNLFYDAPEMVSLCEQNSLASINRTPLAMGLLTGKYSNDSRLNSDDVRRTQWGWGNGPLPTLKQSNRILSEIREQLTSDGRSLAQAALGWIWARSPITIPIPGFKTSKQIEENVEAMSYGPLKSDVMKYIQEVKSTKNSPFAKNQ